MLEATMRRGSISQREGLGERHTDEKIWACSEVDGSTLARYSACAQKLLHTISFDSLAIL